MSSPRDWIRHIADIQTANDHSVEISAQVSDAQRLVLIGSHAIDIDQMPAVYAALTAAVDALNAA
ncbi:hypothetical protein [Rhodococcus sp. UNC363MFTsu5.1]|uniref:hypothetical protein n=1 Tax=Rhodococcus sp. UNC363MFTsu5.1 TaxID=1449069 RepID=UPI000485093F|nr:hypothetical protein [Rhodococcus sp. UNC363MFTsu5.1]